MNDKENIKDIISEYTCDCQKMNGSSDCYGCVHSDEYGKKCYLESSIAQALSNAGYGKVEDYKKEIERLKKDLECYQEENNRLYKHKRDLEDQMIANGWAEYVNDKVLTLKDSKQQAIKEFSIKILDFCKLKEQEFSKVCKSKREESENDYKYAVVIRVKNFVRDLLKEYGVE